MHAHIGFYIIFLMTLSLVGVHKNGPITPSPTLLFAPANVVPAAVAANFTSQA